MNNVDQKDLFFHMSKGNHTTPADARMEGLKSAFGAKAALFKQVMEVGSLKKQQSDVYSSDSDSESDDMSDSDGFLELTDDEQDEQQDHYIGLQVVCNTKLLIVKRTDAFDSSSPKVDGCPIRSPISQSVFAKAVKCVDAKLAAKTKSEECMEQQMDNLKLKVAKGGKPAPSVKSTKSNHAAMQETQHETSKLPAMPVSNKLQML